MKFLKRFAFFLAIFVGLTIAGAVAYRVAFLLFPKNKIMNRSSRIITRYYYQWNASWHHLFEDVSFTAVKLQGAEVPNPTSLQFGPDGKLYVASQHGLIYRYTVRKESSRSYIVSDTEVIDLVNRIPNHDDYGQPDSLVRNRQIAGILLTGTKESPVMYVTSSDPRTGGAEMAAAVANDGDVDLDTNSGTVSRLTLSRDGWSKVDLVRGLPRSEEFHSQNGMVLDSTGTILYVSSGGNTNAGAPSVNFGKITEYALSACILKIDLKAIDAMPVKGTDNNRYIYDLPTVDDPERANTPDGGDINDPFGGNDGLNQAKLVPGGPVQIFAVGYRNAFDIVITKTAGKEGRMYTVDNGPNRGWGGYPEKENSPDVTNNYPPDEPGSIRDGEDDESVNNLDNLHLVYKEGMKEPWYGGHPTPIRANPKSAGLFWKNKEGEHFSLTPTVDWPPVPVEMANPIESDFRGPGIDDGYLSTFDHSTNGLTEYSATGFFDGAMAGDLVAASFNGAIYRTKLNKAGTRVLFQEVLAEGFAFLPLDVVAQSDTDVFPGTIWVADFQGNSIYVLDPVTAPQWNEYLSEDNSAPTARHEASFVKAGGKFYLLGGRGKLPVNQYDPATRRWTSVSPIPGNQELNHFQAVTLDDKIYIVGAFTGEFPTEKPVPDIYVYDPANDQWEVRHDIIPPSRQRGAAAAVAYENKIYIVGGSTNGHTNGFVSWTDVYDPATNTWTSLPDTPHARDHFQAAVLDGKLYAIGGRRSNIAEGKVFEDMEPAVDAFDFANNTWKTLPSSANIPTLRAGAATVVFEDRILVIGGESAQPKAHNTVEAFTPATESWASYPHLITGRHGTQAVVYDNHIYIAAGSGNQGGSPELATMERFTPGTVINCTGMNNSTELDDDGDGYSNKDEIDNGTNPCSPASKPGDFDQDMLSDLRDQDDDADNIPDNRDALHLDASNGRDNKLPLHYPFLNGDPGKGLFGLGFTGLMHNANQDPARRYQANADGLIMGGAAGMATVPANAGLAITNDQEQAFQFGVAVDSSYLGFRVESRLVGPYFKAVPLDALKNEIQGIFVGTGDQDNYVSISITPNANNAGIQIWVEDGGKLIVDTFYPVPGLLEANIFLILEIDMTTGLVQPKYKLEANLGEVKLGAPFKIGDVLLQRIKNSQAAAVGLIASSRNGTPFSATWDFLNIDPILKP